MTSPLFPEFRAASEMDDAELRERVGDDDRTRGGGLESLFAPDRPWRWPAHQVGYIAAGAGPKLPIVSAATLEPDLTLRGARIDLHLDLLRVYDYPGNSEHQVMVAFKAVNATESGDETVLFSQAYDAGEGSSAGVRGKRVFGGLSVAAQGLSFQFTTVNVQNEADEHLMSVLRSDVVSGGLGLLTAAQPALKPLAGLAKGLVTAVLRRNRNVKVQDFTLGLDFNPQGTGAALAVGSYVVAQVRNLGDVDWSRWVYDQAREGLFDASTGEGFPFNALVFRVTPWAG